MTGPLDDGFDMPSGMYDSMRDITRVSVVFFSIKSSPTHYQGAVLFTTSLRFYPKAININGYLFKYLDISKYMEMACP